MTRFHHNPAEAAEEHRTLVYLVHVADRIAAEHGCGFRLDENTEVSKAAMEGSS